MFLLVKCLLLGHVVLAADRAGFENCNKSSYCTKTAEQLGRWRWQLASIDVEDSHKLLGRFRRACLTSGEQCQDEQCSCESLESPTAEPSGISTTEAPNTRSQYEYDHGLDLSTTVVPDNFVPKDWLLTITIIEGGAGFPCAIRVSGQLEGLAEYAVPAEIFANARKCSSAEILKEANGKYYVLKAGGKVIAALQPEPLMLINYFNDKPILQLSGFVAQEGSYGLQSVFADAESQHGLAEHTVGFDLPTDFLDGSEADKHEWYRFYNADVFEYELNTPMAMYASLPWLATVHGESVSGMLSLQPSELYIKLGKLEGQTSEDRMSSAKFVLGSEHNNNQRIPWNRSAALVGEHSRMDLVIYTGDRKAGLSGLTQQMSAHTGHAPLPPTAALGLHQARWNYDSEDDVEYVSANYVKHQIPLDYIWLDIDHSEGRQYFTWNERFKHPEKMRRTLLERKQNLVVIVDPHVKAQPGYPLYDKLVREKLLVLDEYGKRDYHGWCWPGDSVYSDTITRSAELTKIYEPFFAKWPQLYHAGHESPLCPGWATSAGNWSAVCELLTKKSINTGVWIDMNEPSVFNSAQVTMPKKAKHGAYDHSQVHNAYGLFFAKTVYNALIEARPHERPFVLTRSAFVGSQKYGAIWTGDNIASLQYLRNSIPMMLSFALAGYSFVGADVSGFFGEPDTELFYKWLHVGIWYPFFRIHSTLGSARREIYTLAGRKVGDKDFVDAARELIDLRYSLMPFWATSMYRHSTEGLPIWTSLLDFSLRHQLSLPPIAANDGAFIVGDTFFVYPDLRLSSERETGPIVNPPLGLEWLSWPDLAPYDTAKPFGVFAHLGQIIFTKEVPRLNVESQRYDPYTLTILLPEKPLEPICSHLVIDDMKTVEPSTLITVCATPRVGGWSVQPVNVAPSGLWSTKISHIRVRCANALRVRVKSQVLTVLGGLALSERIELDLQDADWSFSIETS